MAHRVAWNESRYLDLHRRRRPDHGRRQASILVKVTVELPVMLALGRPRTATVDAATVRDALRRLDEHYPGISEHFFDEKRRLRPLIQIAVRDNILSHDAALDCKIEDGDTITILQAIAGGSQ
jgi:molybdopterin converting factor small subunit